MNLEQIKQLDLEAVQKDPKWHLEVLYHFKEIVQVRILGQEDPEWRAELEFLLERTNQKINEVRNSLA